ncbi:VOC family protein [Geodermatophilus sp. CPCC 206100]|uniref:VOC family protein n=1 Tax=Geodermatophilus sp. CPCC 206100 TaxID=3020054 RepID=UPI003AFF6B82
MRSFGEIYHTGLVVEDLETAMAELTAVLGLTWTPVEDRELPVVTPDGPLTVRLRWVYSRRGPCRLELLEPVPGTVWERPVQPSSGAGGAHHVGVWAEDLAAASDELVAAGYPRVLTFDDGSGGAARFVYHRLPTGPLVELVDAARRPALEAWFAGAPYPAAGTEPAVGPSR